MNEQNQVAKFTSITGIELHYGETYWYPSVTYCCHFSKTTIHDFKFNAGDSGNLQFALTEPLYQTKEDVKVIVNKVRFMFGYSPIN